MKWKGVFDQATDKANSTFLGIKEMLADCDSHNKTNTEALKLVLDA